MARQDKYLEKLKEHLDHGEIVQCSVLGAYETSMKGGGIRNGIFVATNKRLLFFSKKLAGYDMEVFPYSKISSIEMGKNSMGYYISFFTSGNKARMKWIKVDGVAELVRYVKERIGGGSVSKNDDDITSQIQELAELMKQGLLTEEEFTAKKKQILNL